MRRFPHLWRLWWLPPALVCLLLAALAPTGQAQPPAKLDPALRWLVSGAASPSVGAVLGKTVALPRDPAAQPLSVLVLLQPDARPADWLPPGGRLQAQVGDVAAVGLPLSALADLAQSPAVRFVQADHLLRPLNDLSVPDTGAPLVHGQGLRGEGVIVGLIDTGIDWTHPDFRTPDGHTRISALLDLSDPGDRTGDDTLDGYFYGGTLYNRADLNAALVDNGLALTGGGGEIPDFDPAGVALPLTVEEDVRVRSLAVTVRIRHADRGDLSLALVAPWGETLPLLAPSSGASRADIEATFEAPNFVGHPARGVWQLVVADGTPGRTGRVESWTLHLNQLVRATDRQGHGTHIAGTAAGNGQGTGDGQAEGTYAGVAPAADLVVVKATRGDAGGFRETELVAGLEFIERWAREHRQPFVVNLSVGTHVGAHDGTSLTERTIDRLAAPYQTGRAVVVAAGNEGGQDIHAAATLAPGRGADLGFDIPPGGGVFMADLWYSAQTPVRIAYRGPDGVLQRLIAPDDPARCDRFTGGAEVCLWPSGPYPLNNAYEVQVLFNVTEPAGRWSVALQNDGGAAARVDGWAVIDGTEWKTGVERGQRIAMPGTAREAITVGAYTTRARWTGGDGLLYTTDGQVGALAPFSSDGPTRDGRVKPDLTAPGQAVFSTLSAWASVGPGQLAPDGLHSVRQGTSMAAPHVAGAAALLLQLNSSLTPREIRDALTLNARREEGVARPVMRWGAGKLDVAAAVAALRAPRAFRLFLPLLQNRS